MKKGDLFGSHKYSGKSALRYELGVNILARNLVWVEGPYPAGMWPDLKIFNNILVHCLEPGECVEANNGYMGHPEKVKCPHNDCNLAENLRMQGAARSRHETFNGCLKNWGILEKNTAMTSQHMKQLFYTCAMITQLSVVNREPLFNVEYGKD